MVRSLGLPRLVAGLSVIPFAAVLAVACGGSDVVDSADGSAFDAHFPDSKLPDAFPEDDGTFPEDDGSSPDDDSEAPDAQMPDGGMDADASRDADAGLIDADAALDARLDADAALDARLDADAALDASFDASDSGTIGLFQSLGSARPFVILSGTAVTNSGINTVLLGDVGSAGAASISGLTGPPFQPSGTTQMANAVVGTALADVTTAYNALQGAACGTPLTGQDLGSLAPLRPGVYCFTSSALMAGATTLTFDAQGDPNAVWIIQIGTSLTIADTANMVVIGGLPSLACRIFWVAGASATIGVGAHAAGNILALAGVQMNTNASLFPGRAFGQNAAVTLLSNNVSASSCQ